MAVVLVFLLFICGCTQPEACSDFSDDVCGLFDCMVPNCWCDDFMPVLYEGSSVNGEAEVTNLINEYLLSEELDYGIVNIIELNEEFYNVFVTDESGDEIVYTVHISGTIISTICGV